MNIFDICDPEVYWDRLTLALWTEAQQRHGNKIRIKAKRDSKTLFLYLSWLMSLVAALFGSISAIFSREKTAKEGWHDSWKSAPFLLEGEFSTFSYTIYVPGDGRLLYMLPADKRFEIIWHQISHIDFLYLGSPFATDILYPQPTRSKLIELYDRFIGCNIVRFMWIFWRWPFGHATFRQDFEMAGFLCEVRVELVAMDGTPSDIRRQLLAELFGGPTYGYMATRRQAAQIANAIMDQATNEWRNGWIQQQLEQLEQRYFIYYPDFVSR